VATPNPTPLSLPSLGVSSLDLGRLWQRRRPFFLCSSISAQNRHFGLEGQRQKRSRAVAQGLGIGCAKVLGWESWKTLVSVWAYHSFSEEVEASNTP
jgi:hypothetical protein